MRLNNKQRSNVYRSEGGAVDLVSIMVGIIVIGLIGGVVSATVFAVIPWSQDNAAKEQLNSVAAAQAAYIGASADSGAIRFGNATDLTNSPNKFFDAKAANVKIATTGEGTEAHYIAATRSASGKYWYTTDTLSSPKEANGKNGNANDFVVRWTVLTTDPAIINGIQFPANTPWTGAVNSF